MTNLILFIFLFSFSVFASSDGIDKLKFESNPPTSDVPSASEGGYKFPCIIDQINAENIQYVEHKNSKNESLNFTVSATNIINSSKFITDKQKLTVYCEDDKYIFDPDNKDSSKIEKSFELLCDNGSLKRIKGTEFCDKKCDILPLRESNYRILNDILLPGQTTEIKCPDGQITQTGKEFFKVKCEQNGLITKKTPECFDKDTACKYRENDYLKEGTQLQCSGNNNTGLNIINCEKGGWTRNPKTCDDNCFETCKLSITDLNFNYVNLNDTIDIALEETISISEIQDACKEPDGTIKQECKGAPVFCDYDQKKYAQQDEIVLLCSGQEKYFRCYGENFVPTIPDKVIEVIYTEITDPICNGAVLIKEIPFNNDSNKRTTPKKTDFRQRQLEFYRLQQTKK